MDKTIPQSSFDMGILTFLYGVVHPDRITRFLPIVTFSMNEPASLFRTVLLSLVLVTLTIKLGRATKSKSDPTQSTKEADLPESVRLLRYKFLSVFWCLRIAFWMSGPYFYAAYASKIINGEPASVSLISQISLTGYGVIAVFGPLVGRFTDQHGRKLGTIAAAILYGVGNLSVVSNELSVLFLGRALAGMGTSMLSSSPEAWFISEAKHKDRDPKGIHIGKTFGLAYSMDSIMAIVAGQLAGMVATNRGPTGPYQVSPIFLLLGSAIALIVWTENRGNENRNIKKEETTPSISDALKCIVQDPKIMAIGAVQCFFEAAMYIFVIAWSPTLNGLVKSTFGESTATPYGTVFSCFMACCMLGSTLFGIMTEVMKLEHLGFLFLIVASLSISCAALAVNDNAVGFWPLVVSYFLFETCVGIYFPSIGTLRSIYLPDSHRSLIMTIFGVPLNLLLVVVFLQLHRLGNKGALIVCALLLGLASTCMLWLEFRERWETKERAKQRWQGAFQKAVTLNKAIQGIMQHGRLQRTDGSFEVRDTSSFNMGYGI